MGGVSGWSVGMWVGGVGGRGNVVGVGCCYLWYFMYVL